MTESINKNLYPTSKKAIEAIEQAGFVRESLSSETWRSPNGDVATMRKVTFPDGQRSQCEVTITMAAEERADLQAWAIADTLRRQAVNVEEGRDEVAERTAWAIRRLTDVAARLAKATSQEGTGADLRYALSNAESEFRTVGQYLMEAATKASIGATSQDFLHGHGAVLMSALDPERHGRLVAEKLAEIKIVG